MTAKELPEALAGQGLLAAGAAPEEARLAVVCIHGRGASAEDIIGLGGAFGLDEVLYVAPQAPGGSWYPARFIEPLEVNEPHLTNALERIDGILAALRQSGFSSDRLVLAGFSQGACLSLEYLARNAGSVAAVLGFSGGLIGPQASDRPETESLAGTKVFLGCSQTDPHIPALRVMETERHLLDRGAEVSLKFYREPGHTINSDEIARAVAILKALG